MQEIFADGIRTIAVVNGVVRIELAQLRRSGEGAKLAAEPVARLMIPATAMAPMLVQIARTMEQTRKKAEQASASQPKPADPILT